MKRPCRTCGQLVDYAKLDFKRVPKLIALPGDYICPTCGKIDEQRRNDDIKALWKGGMTTYNIAHRVRLPRKEVVAVIFNT